MGVESGGLSPIGVAAQKVQVCGDAVEVDAAPELLAVQNRLPLVK